MAEMTEWEPSAADGLPRAPGAYLLLIEVTAALTLRVGRLGEFALAAGRYAYVGSARGPGGLAGRVRRHLSPARRPHWHVDALTALAPVVRIYAVASPEPLECAWVQSLLAQPGCTAPIPGFGSSDCRCGCPAHLVRVGGEVRM
jgi:Uri superfamily endonuclease